MRSCTLLAALFTFTPAFLTGCQSNGGLHSERDRQMTVGTVQKEIRLGMSSVDVAEALGSPNQVRYQEGKEVWIYDKIATEASYRNTESGVGAGVAAAGVPGNVLVLGNVNAARGSSRGESATTQRTLTVIIRYGQDDRVESFSYHSSSF
jgi:hypothetical protein